MPKESIVARQSKKYFIFVCICVLLLIAFFGGLSIFAIYNVLTTDYSTKGSDQLFGDVFATCFSLVILILFLTLLIYLIIIYKIQTDIFTTDKVIRKRGKKIIFELPYQNILTITEGYFGLLAFKLKSHIILVNGKKGTRNFFEHYSRADIFRIKGNITEKYYNIPFN